MKLIDLYYKWMETGNIKDRPKARGQGGLCNAVPIKYYETLKMFEPEIEDYATYWGHEAYAYGGDISQITLYNFSPRRQTIILLICAIHNEL